MSSLNESFKEGKFSVRYFIRDNFYLDVDSKNQLRLTGVGNHLLCGLSFPSDIALKIAQVESVESGIRAELSLEVETLKLHIPLVSDIRTLRSFTEQEIPHPSFEALVKRRTSSVLPRLIAIERGSDFSRFRFWNEYHEGDQKFYYGCILEIPTSVQVWRRGNYLGLKSVDQIINFSIRSYTNVMVTDRIKTALFHRLGLPHNSSLDKFLVQLYEQQGREIEHLVRSKKTSSFEYGTIFPRDWIEAADLGEYDLTPRSVDYMYEQAMRYINEKGEGWHEDIIGDYKTKQSASENLIDRKMIDIEPHYILGFNRLSRDFLTREDIHEKMKLVAHFVISNARQQQYISFKKLPTDDGYYIVGNWRDSAQAFPRQKSPLSPFDVNCVFYPGALQMIKDHSEYFGVDWGQAYDEMLLRWQHNKLRYRLYHPNNIIGYSLALHGKKSIPLPIAHLDEAYDMFYGQPSMEEVDSFARKLSDPEYFYTPVGPLLVDVDDDHFDTKQYHGKVIWPKQAAFAVAGLSRQLQLGRDLRWPNPVIKTVQQSILKTCEACFTGWQELKSVPELYYYDDVARQARFYTEQESYEGQMSVIQLWSAVGARRIIYEYQRCR